MEHWRSRSTGRRYRYRSVRTSFPQLTDFWGEGGILTIAAVARTAGVSREFVHSRPYFHRAVIAAVKTSRDARALLTPSDAIKRGLAADRGVLLNEITRQRNVVSKQEPPPPRHRGR
jgi:hypothetical protein